jgi:DNA-binding MarR family transcriptional regulator
MQTIYDMTNSLGHLTGLASRLFGNLLSARFQAAGIDMTPEQWGAIVVLLDTEALSQRDLSDQLYLDKSSVSRLIAGLEKRGWVERTRDPDDSRKKLLVVTETAQNLAIRCSPIARSVLSDAQVGLDDHELQIQKYILSKIISNLRSTDL